MRKLFLRASRKEKNFFELLSRFAAGFRLSEWSRITGQQQFRANTSFKAG
jgi:hypothetical protein